MEIRVTGPGGEASQSDGTFQWHPSFMDMPIEEFHELATSIVIVIPHRESEGISGALTEANGWWSQFGSSFMRVPDEHMGDIELLRNGIVRTFLDHCRTHPQIRYLVWIDSDENVPVDAPYRLARWDKDVVTGVVCSYTDGRGVYANFTVKDRNGVARFPSFRFTKTMPARGLMEINSCGAGLMCVKKEVLETLVANGEAPFMVPEEIRRRCAIDGVKRLGEDIAFCKQAQKYGFKIYVDFSVQAVHYKVIGIRWPVQALDFELDPQKWEVDVKDYYHGEQG